MTRQTAAVGIRDQHPAESRSVEHRCDADISGANVDPAPGGVDGVGLDAGCPGFPRRVDDPQEQCLGDTGAGDRPGSGSSRSTTPGDRRRSGWSASSSGGESPFGCSRLPNPPPCGRRRPRSRAPAAWSLPSARATALPLTCHRSVPWYRTRAMAGTGSRSRRSLRGAPARQPIGRGSPERRPGCRLLSCTKTPTDGATLPEGRAGAGSSSVT